MRKQLIKEIGQIEDNHCKGCRILKANNKQDAISGFLKCHVVCEHGKRLKQIGDELSELKSIQKARDNSYSPPVKRKPRRSRTTQEKV